MIPWPEQEAIFWKRARRSYWRITIFLLFQKPRVIEEAFCRYQRGYYHFGDNAFHRTGRELFREKLEEAADLLCYQIMEDEKEERR